MPSSIWNQHATSTTWNDPSNWTGDTVPTETAQFGPSSQTTIGFAPSSAASVQSIIFAADAPAYTFLITALEPAPALIIDGAGIVNNSPLVQSFVVASFGGYYQPQLKFAATATAGSEMVLYQAGPPSLETTYGGGTIAFFDDASAGSAQFVVRTGKQRPPNKQSTLGGQVTFSDHSVAGHATFSIFGTLGTDGDTFGNAVFQDQSSADHGTFTNHGGTVPGGDGGNTQFYDTSTAASGCYLNHGGSAHDGTVGGANGGDVAFDGLALGGHGYFHNYPASVAGANGGVTSFNNNPNYPAMPVQGASADHGTYLNYGATTQNPGGGGHTEFTARYGMATAGDATLVNFGSDVGVASSAGHTIFSITPPNDFFPSAGNATIWNLPGLAGGYAVFQTYGKGTPGSSPTAANATFHNLGGTKAASEGGYTLFCGVATAAEATLIAHGGTNGGQGGRVVFADNTTGGSASVQLSGNAILDLTGHDGGLTLGTLNLMGGILCLSLGPNPTLLTLTGRLTAGLPVTMIDLTFPSGMAPEPGQDYALLQAPNLAAFQANQFTAARIGNAVPEFRIDGTTLMVSYKFGGSTSGSQ